MTQRITQYLGRDNPSLAILEWDGVTLTSSEMGAITRVDVRYKGSYLSSNDFPALFDWTTYASSGYLEFDLGSLDLPADRDEHAEIIAFDDTYTNGRVVGVVELTISDEAKPDGTLTDVLSYTIALNDLNDVDTSSKATNYALTWTGSNWQPKAAGGISNLGDLGDVVTSGAAQRDVLTYDGSYWVPGSLSIAIGSLSNVNVSSAVAGQPLFYTGSNYQPIALSEPSANATARGDKTTAAAGEAMIFGDLAYKDFATGTYKKAKGSALATMPCIRMATGTIAAGSEGIFLVSGVAMSNLWSFTGSAFLYVSPDSAGLMTQNNSLFGSGEIAQVVGCPISSNAIEFRPSLVMVELS